MRICSQLREEETCRGRCVEGRGAAVADGELRADGDVVIGGAEVNVEVERGVGDGLTLGVGGGERGAWLRLCGGPALARAGRWCFRSRQWNGRR